jgi:hypothetical protein
MIKKVVDDDLSVSSAVIRFLPLDLSTVLLNNLIINSLLGGGSL